jgi:hypothetical protein
MRCVGIAMSLSSWVKRRTSWLGKFTLLAMVMTISVLLAFDMQQFQQLSEFLCFSRFLSRRGSQIPRILRIHNPQNGRISAIDGNTGGGAPFHAYLGLGL